MKVPLILDLERLYTTSNRVLRKLVEVGHPVRVDRPVRLETAALPVEKFLVALVRRRLNGVVDGQETGAGFHQFAELLKVVALKCRVATAAVGVDYHGVRPLKDRLVTWPAVELHHRGNEL